MPINNIWGLPFSPDIRESLRIRHLFKFPLCEFWLLWIIRNRLPQRTLIQLRTLHIHEQELIILLVNQVIDAMGQRALLAHTTHNPKSLIKRGRPFRLLDFVNAWQAEQMLSVTASAECGMGHYVVVEGNTRLHCGEKSAHIMTIMPVWCGC